MAEVRTNLGQGVLAADYAGGLGDITVTPSALPRGPFPTSGVFSVELVAVGQTAGPIYTVSAVVADSGNQVLTLSALEFGTDAALPAGAAVVEVESVRSLQALIDQSVTPGGAGFNPTTQTDATGSRSFNTVFHNTTGGPIWVSVVAGSSTSFDALTDSANPPTLLVASMPSGGFTTAFLVLKDNFYRVNTDPGATLVKWIEWSGTGGGGGGGASFKYEWIPAAINQNASQYDIGFSTPATSAANLNLPTTGNQLFGTGLQPPSVNFLFGRRIPDEWDGSDLTFDLDAVIDGGTGDVVLTGYLGPVTPGNLVNPVSWGSGVVVTVTAPNVAGTMVRFSFALDASSATAGDFIFVAVLRGVDSFLGSIYPLGGLFGIKY